MHIPVKTRREPLAARSSDTGSDTLAPSGEGASDLLIAGRRAWNERYGNEISNAAYWRYTAFAALTLAFFSVAWTCYISSQSRFVPFVVETNKLGDAVAVRPLSPAPIHDEAVIHAQLARWIVDVRSVYGDAPAENALLTDGYATVQPGSQAYLSLNDYLHNNNPFSAGGNKTVTVDVHTVLPISANVYQIKWTETETGKNDGTSGSTNWTAIVTVVINPPSSEAAIDLNPEGVYVTQFSWSRDVN